MDPTSQQGYLESVLAEVERGEEGLQRLLVEAKLRRNHNVGRLRAIHELGERLKWRDERGLLGRVRAAINEGQ